MSTKRRFLAERARKERDVFGATQTTVPGISAIDTTLQGMQTTLTAIDTSLNAIEASSGAAMVPGLELSAGRITGTSAVQKFGFSGTIGTTFKPLTLINDYRMRQAASAVTLRVKAGGNAADTAAGAGAREVTLIGLNQLGAEVTEAVATAGASASSATTATFIRLYRAYVSSSGAYADGHTTFSQAAAITIEDSGAANDWGTLGAQLGQTQIGAYTVPLGKTAYIQNITLNVSSSKAVSFKFMQRRDVLTAAAPYKAWRLIRQMDLVTGRAGVSPNAPFGPFPALTDLCFFAKTATGTGSASVDFEIILETA